MYKQAVGIPESLRLKLDKSKKPYKALDKMSSSSKVSFDDYRTYKDEDGYYHIYPVACTAKIVYVICPYCKRIHRHGNFSKSPGWRFPHCWEIPKGKDYFIESLESEEPRWMMK